MIDRNFIHTTVTLTCWGLTGMFAALTLIQQAAGR